MGRNAPNIPYRRLAAALAVLATSAVVTSSKADVPPPDEVSAPLLDARNTSPSSLSSETTTFTKAQWRSATIPVHFTKSDGSIASGTAFFFTEPGTNKILIGSVGHVVNDEVNNALKQLEKERCKETDKSSDCVTSSFAFSDSVPGTTTIDLGLYFGEMDISQFVRASKYFKDNPTSNTAGSDGIVKDHDGFFISTPTGEVEEQIKQLIKSGQFVAPELAPTGISSLKFDNARNNPDPDFDGATPIQPITFTLPSLGKPVDMRFVSIGDTPMKVVPKDIISVVPTEVAKEMLDDNGDLWSTVDATNKKGVEVSTSPLSYPDITGHGDNTFTVAGVGITGGPICHGESGTPFFHDGKIVGILTIAAGNQKPLQQQRSNIPEQFSQEQSALAFYAKQTKCSVAGGLLAL